MEKKIEKSEFLSKVEAFAHEMTTMTEKKEGVKRGLVILAAESVESENGTKQIISVLGNGGKVWKRLPDLLHRNTASHF